MATRKTEPSPAEEGAPVEPPIEPMLAKIADELPSGDEFLYEPKWDGFRAIVFRSGADVYIQSRDLRPLDRYFPDLHQELIEKLPPGCVVDGEIVIVGPKGLDFDALQLRLHPAASRVAKLAAEAPAAFVAFDLIAAGGRDLRAAPQSERRARLEELLASVAPPVHLTPMTRDRAVAVQWLERFEGAGLDGVIAKFAEGTYEPGKRAMIKVKHSRTADCVVAGFRWHKSGHDRVGSLLLGSRWSAGKDLSWEPLRIERVCEVKYDHLQGNRFRHAAVFLRWRFDKPPAQCRYDQLEVTKPYELEKVFGASG
jgi:ATP-dependent DNA ligase